jgi:hypothetical protein
MRKSPALAPGKSACRAADDAVNQATGVRQFFGGSHKLLKAGCQTRRIWRSG